MEIALGGAKGGRVRRESNVVNQRFGGDVVHAEVKVDIHKAEEGAKAAKKNCMNLVDRPHNSSRT
jgi:hypothetical protein